MPLSRRSFLRSGTLTAFAAGCAFGPGRLAFGQNIHDTNPAVDFQIPYEATQNPVFYYTRQTFEPYVGGIFRGRAAGGGPVSLELLRATGYSPSAATRIMTKRARPTDSFSLTFRAARPLSELSTIHTLEHAALGKFDLFMTRAVEGRGRVLYEAVINHVV